MNSIYEWQQRFKEQPLIYWTAINCEPTGNFYESKEAAQIEVDWHNGLKGVYSRGRMAVHSARIHNMSLSRERWLEPEAQ